MVEKLRQNRLPLEGFSSAWLAIRSELLYWPSGKHILYNREVPRAPVSLIDYNSEHKNNILLNVFDILQNIFP